MDQIYTYLLNATQTTAERGKETAPSDTKNGESSFQTMLNQKQQEVSQDNQTGPALKETGRETAETPAADSDLELELELQMQQMALAAAVMLPGQAVPMAQEPAEIQADALLPAAVETEIVDVQAAPQLMTAPAPEEEAQLQAQPQAQAELDAADQTPVSEIRPEGEQVHEPEETRRAEGPTVRYGRAEEPEKPEVKLEHSTETPVFHEVREIPVKVGEVETAPQTEQPKAVALQVEEKLAQALEQGETKVELQLEPRALGSVRVEMVWNRDGGLHITLHAENSHTRSLLEREMFGLQQNLSRDTQQEVRVEVPRQQESQQQNFYDGRSGGQQQNRHPQEQRQNQQSAGEDFLHQLRLGLVSLTGEAS